MTGMGLASVSPDMRVLEARFHPHSKKSGAPVAVARVLLDRERTLIEPIEPPLQRLEPFDTGALMRKLAFLVESAKPRPFEQLTTLRSEFWSFTEVSARYSRAG
jgi:hypothetical protein